MSATNEYKEEQFIRKIISEQGLSEPSEGFADRVAEKIEAAPVRTKYKPILGPKVKAAAVLLLLSGFAASLLWEPSGKYQKYTEIINWNKLIMFSEQFAVIFISVFAASLALLLIDKFLSRRLFRRRFLVW